MKNYVEYEIVDFLLNDSFVGWATGKSLKENAFWFAWPDTYPEKAEVYYQALEIVSNLHIVPAQDLSEAEISELITKIGQKAFNADIPAHSEVKKLSFTRTWLQIAASILLISTIGVWAYLKTTEQSGSKILVTENATEIEQNQSTLIRLPDNSTVVLKPGSKLSYSKTFTGKTRDVYLDGEAFFEVSKDKARPFIVHTNELITKVLGTSFSVKAYSADKEFNVTVNTGKVSVFTKKSTPKADLTSTSLENLKGVLITSNQQVSFYRSETKLIKKKLETPTPLSEEVSQITLNFKETPFSTVVAELSKAYDIKINYDEETMSGCPLTASLSNQHLYERLELICQALEARYKIENGQVFITGKGCTVTN